MGKYPNGQLRSSLGNNLGHQLPLFATLNATGALHGKHNLAKKVVCLES